MTNASESLTFLTLVFILVSMLNETLKQIGLSSNESRSYLELLTIGCQPVSVLSRRLLINRTTVYSILRSLQSKGLVSSFVRAGVRVFSASDPNSLVGYLDRQCQHFEYCRSDLLRRVNDFRDLAKSPDFSRPMVAFHDGLEAIKSSIYNVIHGSKDFYAYFNPAKWMRSRLKNFLINLCEESSSRQVSLKCISPELAENHRFFDLSGLNFGHIAYISELDCEMFFDAEMLVSDERVVIFKLDRGFEYAVVLEGAAIAMVHRLIFDIAYRSCEGGATLI